MRTWTKTLLCCAAILAAPALAAKPKALLIGVNDYEANLVIADLKGPKNDVLMMRDALAARGVAEFTILADAVPGATRPTRAAIMQALDTLARRAQPDDFIVIHFSGHGSRQPDRNGDETDGWDEVIMPIDTQPATRGTGLYPNAITDDEIGAAVDAIRKTGADVWLVLDSCYSGTALRGASGRVAARYVEPSVLGNPGAPVFASGPAFSDADLPAGAGHVIAFYAAQPTEKALEIDLSEDGAPEQWYGVFSSHLAAQMQGAGALSFRQLFQATLHAMNTGQTSAGLDRQTPLWEGDLIDRTVLAARSASGIKRFEVARGQVMAGRVHGLSEGTLLGLVAAAADPADAVIGAAQIEKAEALQSRLRAVDPGCVAAAATLCPAIGPIPDGARFAQIVARPMDQMVRVAPPVDQRTGAALPRDHAAYIALDAAAAETAKLVVDAKAPDVATLWDGQALWFGARTQIEDEPVGLHWQPGNGPLAPLLARIETAVSLSKLLAPLTGSGMSLDGPPVEITVALERSRLDDIVPRGSAIGPAQECKSASAKRKSDKDRHLKSAEQVKQCDKLRFSAQARGPGAYDVNRIWIDSQFCVRPRYARIDDFMQPAKLGPNMIICSECPGGYSAGDESAFFIITEARRNAPPLNLRGLLENCAPPDAAKRGAQTSARAFLNDLIQTPKLRAGLGRFGQPALWVEQIGWTVVPKPVALRGRRQ